MVEQNPRTPGEYSDTNEDLHSQPGLLIILTGSTGAGKTDIESKLLEKFSNIQKLVTFTSREQRENETNGVDYHFVSQEEFENMIKNNEFLEYVKYGGSYKGTSKETIRDILEIDGRDVFWAIDMSRGAQIEETIRSSFDSITAQAILDKTVVILIGTPRLMTLKERYHKRSVDRREFLSRLRQDWKVWTTQRNSFPHIVINETGKIDEAVNQVIDIIKRKRLNVTG